MTPDRPSAPLPSTWQVCRRAWVLSRTIYVGSPRTFKHNLRWAVTVAARQALSRPWFETLATEEMAPFVHANPRLAFSPLGSYLSRTWNWDQRTKVLLDTYEFINNMGGRLKEAMLRPGGLVLARSELGKGLEARIRLGLDNKFRKEGEVAVFFELAPVPGPVAGMAFALEHRQRSADGGAVWPVEAAVWQPPIGRLYVRHLLDADRYEVELCFATGHSPTGSVDYAQLARITRWQAGPYFGGGIDCAKGQRDHTGAGGMVVRWMAYDNDLAAFVRLWADDRTTVGAWALQAAAVAGLDAGDASRLLRVMAAAKGGAS